MTYDGKIVLITGAASGFGRAAAERFAALGARLALFDRNAERLAETVASLTATGPKPFSLAGDVASEDDVARLVAGTIETFGALDVAINNAGIGHPLNRLENITLTDFERTMAVNVRGTFLCMKHEIPAMTPGGAILNVASAAGLLGAPLLSVYAASKHAIVGLTRAAADENARKPIRINALCPSFADTPLLDQMVEQMATDKKDAHNRLSNRVPMRRVATTDEVVQAMLWLCSPDNSFMTGQAIAIDGGLTAI